MHCQRFVLAILVMSIALGCGVGDSEKSKKVDLKEVYSTNGQKDLKEPDPDNKYARLLNSPVFGASNLFIVRGKTIEDAMEATHGVLYLGREGNKLFLDDGREGQSWLVVYWGLGASNQWVISSVGRVENTLTVSYEERRSTTAIVKPYYAWIPLGEPSVGTYQLEMIDSKAKQKTLVRIFDIIGKR